MSSKVTSKVRRSRSRPSAQDPTTGRALKLCPCDGLTPDTSQQRHTVYSDRMRGSRSKGLRCALCGSIVCRACSRVVRPSARIRLCGTCFQHREIQCPSGEWIYRELKTKFHDVTPSSSSESSMDANMEVREFIERLTENLVHGSVDDVTVEALSCHPQYEALCTQFHRSIQDLLSRLSESLQQAVTEHPPSKVTFTGESPSEVHVQLKRVVSDLRVRALELPLLEMDSFGNDEEDGQGVIRASAAVHDFSRRTYEDLLATAIINKVVETTQCVLINQHLRTPGISETSLSPTVENARFISSIQIGVEDHQDNAKHQRPFKEEDGESEEEELKNSETSRRRREESMSTDMQRFLADLKYSHRVPFPELGADIVEGSVQESLLEETARTTLYLVNNDSHHSSLSSASWEENWLFQRRRLRRPSATPLPLKHEECHVPMLVPNPRTEDSLIRARIGDLDADQLSSDLSDYESYMSKDEWSEDEQEDSLEIEKSDGLEIATTIKRPPDLIEATNQEVHSAALILAPLNSNGLSSGNTDGSEFDQQEGEYLEDYASIGQRSLASLQDAFDSNSSLTPESSHVPDILESTQQVTVPVAAPRRLPPEKPQQQEEKEPFAVPPRRGTIAEREHRKWEEAKPIPNNPYTEESIARRLAQRQRQREPDDPSLINSGVPEVSVSSTTPATPDQPLRVNCSGHEVDYRQYGRDYYINELRSAKMDNTSFNEIGGCCMTEGWRLEVAPDEAGLVSETYLEPLSCLRRSASLHELTCSDEKEEQKGGSLRIRSRIILRNYLF